MPSVKQVLNYKYLYGSLHVWPMLINQNDGLVHQHNLKTSSRAVG